MIRCHYTPEVLEEVAKAGGRRTFYVTEILAGLTLCVVIVLAIDNPEFRDVPVLFVMLISVLLCVMPCLTRRCVANVLRAALENAKDEIITDDEYIQQIKEDGTKIMLPRQGLKAAIRYGAPKHKMFDIWNPDVDPNLKITLTSHMENAKELVNAITPGTWSDD